MATSAAGIVFSSLNKNTLSRLTVDRTVAAIPFACRYRLVDFCLSNMINANISNISIVANYNYRSLLEHIGSGKDWDLARRDGGINFISPFLTMYTGADSAKLYSNHMEALKSMKEYISEIKEDVVVLMDASRVLNIDISDVIARHEITGADITFVTKLGAEGYTSKNPCMMMSSVAGKVTDIAMSASFTEHNPEIFLDIFVMKTEYLKHIIREAESYNLGSLTEFILKTYKYANYCVYRYDGYAATVSSFLDYYKYSMMLVRDEKSRDSLLNKKDAPIFTRVHNSAPTVYSNSAKVENSMIADDCIIEGTVINSVLSRGIHVAKGAVVKDSVLFAGTLVESDASLNCIVTDKDVHITRGVHLSGNENMPFFIKKRTKI